MHYRLPRLRRLLRVPANIVASGIPKRRCIDVSQIVAGDELQREGTLSSEFHISNGADSFLGVGAGLLTEKPTITYAPLGGESYARNRRGARAAAYGSPLAVLPLARIGQSRQSAGAYHSGRLNMPPLLDQGPIARHTRSPET